MNASQITSFYKLMSLMALTLVVGCSGAKNKSPLEDYDNLDKDVAPYTTEIIQQKRATCDIVVISEPTLVVTEGQTISSDVYIRGAYAAQADDLTIVSGPEGLNRVSVGNTKEGLKYRLIYTAKLGSLEYNQNFKKFDAELLPASQNNAVNKCPTTVGIVVTRTNEFPVITKISAPKSLDLNSVKPASIVLDVKALNLKSIENLELFPSFDKSASSKENPIFDMSQALSIVSVTPLKNNIYRFNINIDMRIASLLAESAAKYNVSPTIEMLTKIKAFNSESKLDSPSENVVIKFTRPVPAVAGVKK